ncbi:MAG: CvpA family protein [Myxococcales bacterium]
MTLDVWCLVLVGTFAITGMAQGASGQVARVLALAGATAAGFLAGPFLGTLLLRSFPEAVRETLGGLCVGLVAYLLLASILRSAFRRVVDRNAWGRSDRGFGALFGGLQGAYLAWVLVTVVPVLNMAFAARGSHLRFSASGSRAAQFVAKHPFGLSAKLLGNDAALKKTIGGFQKLKFPAQ